ncbi:cellulose binding domain-containing protein [Microbulbifer sp. A4B17]|uniref:cellulose binding domain-containing protein n=1 Tax=Microbulbifer sp. A4B17 TaxID=359370 RepID=UPI001864623C|nr:cellulose binding domain-containing protein [Microbulbifer sp. A4B17]
MTIQSEWEDGYMASVVIRNTGAEPISEWELSWQWPSDQEVTLIWNATSLQNENLISVVGKEGYVKVPVGQAQSFGFNIKYSGGEQKPSHINASCNDTTNNPNPPSRRLLDPLSQYNLILGTQTINPKYTFTKKGSLLESAEAIYEMGSNLLKIALSPSLYSELSNTGLDYQFKRILEEIPEFQQVLEMDFSIYMFWVEDSGSWMDNKGMSEEELQWQYDKVYSLAEYLLTEYSGSGKTFMIGHWEGDWNLVQKTDGIRDDSQETIPAKRIQGLIDWVNIRQKAIDDAKANITHSDVNLYHYIEVNRVESAMQGKERITNAVLPHTNVDLVSYSAYDLTTKEKHSDFSTLHSELTAALEFINSNLPKKSGLPFEKRVFIGEYGYGESWFKDWGTRSGEAQDMLSRNVIKTALQWGTPFILYWQMYDNEYDSWINDFTGYWLVDKDGNKKEIYNTHQKYYKDAKTFLNNYYLENSSLPSESEFRSYALKWFESSKNPTQQSKPDTTPTIPEEPSEPSGQCNVEYTVQSDWGSGFMANVVIYNLGETPLDEWQLQWNWQGNQSITHFWNAQVTESNGGITVTSESPIRAGEAQAFGFNANYSGENIPPIIIGNCKGTTATEPSQSGESPHKSNKNLKSNSIKLWFIGDSITYGMTTLPYNSNGFRSQVWDYLVKAADGNSIFPIDKESTSEQLILKYNGKHLKTIGTISGPTGPDDFSQQTKNYWHSGIPGATTNDLLCYLDPRHHQITPGYNFTRCLDSINNFNQVLNEKCRENASSTDWLTNQACDLTQDITSKDSVVIPIQLGTNDITFLSMNSAIDCSLPIKEDSESAQQLNGVVNNIISSPHNISGTSITDRIQSYFESIDIPSDKIVFLISTIPRRTEMDGQDPKNYCTDFYNQKIRKTLSEASNTKNIFFAEQGNIIPTGDPVHPTTQGHKIMACNLLYGENHGHSDILSCILPNNIPDEGLLKAIDHISN